MNEGKRTAQNLQDILLQHTQALDITESAVKQSQDFSKEYHKLVNQNIKTIKSSQRRNFLSGIAVGIILLFIILIFLSYYL